MSTRGVQFNSEIRKYLKKIDNFFIYSQYKHNLNKTKA